MQIHNKETQLPHFICCLGKLLTALCLMAYTNFTMAQDYFEKLLPLRGFSLTIDAGATLPARHHANFYNGRPENTNTINRIMHSEAYGNSIWNNLVDQGLISPSAIQTYNQLRVAEYADMKYSITYQIGLGVRYDFEGRNTAIFARFDYMKLTAKGAFNLYSGASTSTLSNINQFISCGIWGNETRTYIDFGVSKAIPFNPMLHFVVDAGINLNHYRVQSNDVEIGGATYSILDTWGGQSPMMNSQSYEYYQTGIGYGAFASPCLRLILPHSMAADLGISCYYNKITLPGYSQFAPQFTLFMRFILNNL